MRRVELTIGLLVEAYDDEGNLTEEQRGQPSGIRLAATSAAAMRRALGGLAEQLDAVWAVAEGSPGHE